MSPFRRRPRVATNPGGLGEGFPYRQRTAWMQEGIIEPYPLGGRDDLQVAGESFRQDALRHLTGNRPAAERVSMKIRAALVAENGNPEDPDAVAVWIKDPHAEYHHVGYLYREDARRYRPGLLAQERSLGRPIALAGRIVGGGMEADRAGMLGVFLRHDPAHFTDPVQLVPPQWVPPPSASRMSSTVLSYARVADDSYDLGWMADLPDFDIRAIPMLRKLLATETRPLSRHYMYQRLEDMLYGSRDAFASALDEYDKACDQHDKEMGKIRQACIDKWGEIPHLDTYRQMAIRQDKAGDYRQALRWAERGLAIYSSDCADPEDVEDLRKRAARYRAKLGTA
jgi:tetratricopeptide (TPR) repeat protein